MDELPDYGTIFGSFDTPEKKTLPSSGIGVPADDKSRVSVFDSVKHNYLYRTGHQDVLLVINCISLFRASALWEILFFSEGDSSARVQS